MVIYRSIYGMLMKNAWCIERHAPNDCVQSRSSCTSVSLRYTNIYTYINRYLCRAIVIVVEQYNCFPYAFPQLIRHTNHYSMWPYTKQIIIIEYIYIHVYCHYRKLLQERSSPCAPSMIIYSACICLAYSLYLHWCNTHTEQRL